MERGAAQRICQIHIHVWPHCEDHHDEGGRAAGRDHHEQGDLVAVPEALHLQVVDVDVEQGEKIAGLVFILVDTSLPEPVKKPVCSI